MTDTNKNLFKMLDAEIETRILPKTFYPYIPAREIRTRLNETFGCFWDTEILSAEVIDGENVLLKLRLIAKVGEETIRKEAFGSSTIQKFGSGANKGKPVNLGDAYNNAVTDAIKSCSKQLGIGNRQLDVVKDSKTGKYVEVSDQTEGSTKQPAKEQTMEQEDLKTDEKQNTIEKTSKIIELKKRLAASKNKTGADSESKTAEKGNEQTQEESVTQTKAEDDSVVDHGFDYDGLNGTTDSPKNTQKLVILNLAKMKGVTIEDYIEQIIGKQKNIDELTANEAGLIVRSGLTSTTFKE
jgi:hypothetical protein